MKYFKIEKDGELLAIGVSETIDNGKIEITEEEYNAEHLKIMEKSRYLNQLLNTEITIEDVPEDLREELSIIYEQMTTEITDIGATEDDYINALESLGVDFNG